MSLAVSLNQPYTLPRVAIIYPARLKTIFRIPLRLALRSFGGTGFLIKASGEILTLAAVSIGLVSLFVGLSVF